MDDEKGLRDELATLRTAVSQMHAELRDLRTVLIGGTGSSAAHESLTDAKRVIGDGARAYVGGLSTSPYREGSKEESWWRFGWQLAKDAIKGSRGEW
jgi:hypothetical protein